MNFFILNPNPQNFWCESLILESSHGPLDRKAEITAEMLKRQKIQNAKNKIGV